MREKREREREREREGGEREGERDEVHKAYPLGAYWPRYEVTENRKMAGQLFAAGRDSATR
jgi:hypothetical protein